MKQSTEPNDRASANGAPSAHPFDIVAAAATNYARSRQNMTIGEMS